MLVLSIFAALAIATLVPLWRDAGWPLSHEGNAFALRTHIYARHFSWFDLMPIWSSADASGFGSPMPLMYHKLFYMLAGALALVVGSLKNADLATIAVLLVVGATGMYRTMRALGASRLAATIAGCSLITANYTVTNWLVRGALAEFCAAMVIAWVAVFFVKTIQSARLHRGLGITMGLLWLSHSVLAFYTGLILALTLILVAMLRLTSWAVLNPKTGWPSAVSFAAIAGPYLVPMAILGREYDFNRILTPPYLPAYQFRPPMAYLWEDQWRFGATAAGLTVQLDHAMLVLLLIGALSVALHRPQGADSRWRFLQPVVPFLLVVALGSLLQLPAAAAFYQFVPGAAFIQFPWRLLALITPSLIIAAVYLGDKALPPDGRHFILGGVTMWMVVACGAFAPLRDPRFLPNAQLAGFTFSGFREYEPRQAAPLDEIQARLTARWKEAGCSYSNMDAGNDEVPAVRFHTSCGRAAELPLPIYASPLHMVNTTNPPRGQPCLSLPDFPGVCGAVIPASEDTVVVNLPSGVALAKWAWRQLRGRLRSFTADDGA